VILPCYKTGQFIGEALESVGVQTYTNWEVIAVDDCGPEDGTRGAVEAFAAKFPDHRILYHRHKLNAGAKYRHPCGSRLRLRCIWSRNRSAGRGVGRLPQAGPQGFASR
jgi:glycosyltransferase involved in cell wall biosynthesis